MRAQRVGQVDGSVAAVRGGFTIIELSVSIIIIGTLIGLLLVGFRYAGLAGKTSTIRATTTSLKQATSRFITEFGFPPPLIRDQAGAVVENMPNTNPQQNRLAVYRDGDPNPNYNAFKVLRQTGYPANAGNPFLDVRFSERSIPAYLMGVVEVGIIGSQSNVASGGVLPIDGVAGPGNYPPNRYGGFEIPDEVLRPILTGQTRTRNRAGGVILPMIEGGKRDQQLIKSDTRGDVVALADRNKKPFRYYRWEHGKPDTGLIDSEADLNIPRLIGRFRLPEESRDPPDDRNFLKNPALRSAHWAILAAGPDGWFGDEADFNQMRIDLSLPSSATELQVRLAAERDNVMELGQESSQ